MAVLRYIAVHHSGGTQYNPLASTSHTTHEQINKYHKDFFDFPSSIPGEWGGYNFGYSPITREFHQFRPLGEETAAQRGWNFNTISLCIYGNYMKIPGSSLSVDRMDEYIERDIALFILKLINKDHGLWKIKPYTQFDLSISRVHAHRWFQPTTTECYGTALTDSWVQNILARYRLTKKKNDIEQRLIIYRQLLALFLKIQSLIQQRDAMMVSASPFDRGDCPGHVLDLE